MEEEEPYICAGCFSKQYAHVPRCVKERQYKEVLE